MSGKTPYQALKGLCKIYVSYYYDIDAGKGEQVAAAFEAEAKRLEAA